jgi:hypothetical protein
MRFRTSHWMIASKKLTITDKSKIAHSLVHITSTAPFTESSVCFASQTALNVIVRKEGANVTRKMRSLLDSCAGNPLTSALCGYIYESYALELLEKGGDFDSRLLMRGKGGNKSDNTKIHIPSSSSAKKVADKVLSSQARDQLYVPKANNNNYPAIDAWIPGFGAFQITVGKKHELNSGVIDDLKLLGDGANKLYWILPYSL